MLAEIAAIDSVNGETDLDVAFARAAAANEEQEAERWAALCFGVFESLEDVDAGRSERWTARDVLLTAEGWDTEFEGGRPAALTQNPPNNKKPEKGCSCGR